MRKHIACALAMFGTIAYGDFRPVPYNNPKARPFLKGGLCVVANPIDLNGDGRLDVLLQSWDATPQVGLWRALNLGTENGGAVFSVPERIAPTPGDRISVNFVGKRPLVTTAGCFGANFAKDLREGFKRWKGLPWNVHWDEKITRNIWRLADLNGDGRLDILVGVSDEREYGWGDFYDARGNYKNARPHGYIYWIRNLGTGNGLPGGKGEEKWDEPKLLRTANCFPVEALSRVAPMPFDWDGDGDVDLLCADASGVITYFENIGTKTCPQFAGETYVTESSGRIFRPFLNQLFATAVDWDGDGRMDFMLSDEGGQVGFARNTGRLDGHRAPVFEPPVYLRQKPGDLNLSSLSTPVAVDWDGDGDLDLVSGEAGGRIAFIENLSGPGVNEPSWAEPRFLSCEASKSNPFTKDAQPPFGFRTFENDPICIRAGANGSMLGPVEALYGYTTLTVADWDGDGLLDIMSSSIWGKPLLFRNIGTRTKPRLSAPTGVEVEWEGSQPKVPWGWYHPDREANPKELITQWRTTPCMTDLDGDGLVDLVMLDQNGFFAFFRRVLRGGRRVLEAPERLICYADGSPIKITYGDFGAAGRRKFCFCDWDGDGVTDMIVNGKNADFFRGLGRGTDGKWRFRNEGPMGELQLSGHTTSPTAADFDGDGIPDLVLGTENGFFYRLDNPRSTRSR